MPKPIHRPCGKRAATSKETNLASAGLETAECAVLDIARFYFATFACPDAHAWVYASDVAEKVLGRARGGEAALLTLRAVQRMRVSRKSVCYYNNPLCPCCREVLTEHERQFIGILVALRSGRLSEAKVHALLLCEGNETGPLIAAMAHLSDAIGPRHVLSQPGALLPAGFGAEVPERKSAPG